MIEVTNTIILYQLSNKHHRYSFCECVLIQSKKIITAKAKVILLIQSVQLNYPYCRI